MKKALVGGRRASEDHRASTWASLKGDNGTEIGIDFSFLTAGSVLFDAVYVPGGRGSVGGAGAGRGAPSTSWTRRSSHCKTVGATAEGAELLRASRAGVADEGVIVNKDAQAFIKAMMGHRHWTRQRKDDVPA